MTAGSELVEAILSSDIKADLLVLFRKNPGIIDSMDGIARRIGKVANSIEEDMKSLVELGILTKKHVGKTEVFLLDPARDAQVQEIVSNYLMSLKEK